MDLLDELLQHLLGHGEVGDHAVLHRPDHRDIARRLTEHRLGFLADRLNRALAVRAAFLPDGNHRWLVEHDALTANIDQRIRRAEIDGEIVGEIGA